MDDLKQLKEQYKEELLNNVLPFWIQVTILFSALTRMFPKPTFAP